MKKLLARLLLREDPATYQLKDGSLAPTLTTLDLIGGDRDGGRHGHLYFAGNCGG